MPLSKERQRAWMRAYRAKKKAQGTVLLSKGLVKKLHWLGISPSRYLRDAKVRLQDYGDMKRRYAAKAARVEWQSGGIRLLKEELARARALLVIQSAMQDGVVLQRLTQVEAEMALRVAQEEGAALAGRVGEEGRGV